MILLRNKSKLDKHTFVISMFRPLLLHNDIFCHLLIEHHIVMTFGTVAE